MATNISDDILRARYQQAASFFLLSTLSNYEHKPTYNKRTNEFNPLQTAKSLMLRSMYDESHFSYESSSSHNRRKEDDAIHYTRTQCILSNDDERQRKKEQLCHLKSGASSRTTSISLEKLQDDNETEFHKQQLIREEVNTSCGKSTTSIQQKAALFAKMIGDGDDNSTNNVHTMFNGLSNDFFCNSCALPLFTPFLPNGEESSTQEANKSEYVLSDAKVRLKTLKSSRTKRRRASRYMAAKHTFENDILQKHRGGGKKFATGSSISKGIQGTVGDNVYMSHGSAVATMMETNVALKQGNEIRRIHDGIAKHCVVYTCSYCGHKHVLKGFHRGTQKSNIADTDRKKDLQSLQMSKANNIPTVNKRKRAFAKIEQITDQKVQSFEAVEENDDFISFSAPSSAKMTKITHSNISPLQPKKKKKQHKPKKGKTALMDFLSSLND